MGWYKAFWRWLGHARWFAYAVRYAGARVDRVLYGRWHGRVSVAGPPLFDWLLPTTTGRRSGRPRTTPLVYWPRLLEQWPALASYHARSGERHVFVLEPAV